MSRLSRIFGKFGNQVENDPLSPAFIRPCSRDCITFFSQVKSEIALICPYSSHPQYY